jgi:hypothetical protein
MRGEGEEAEGEEAPGGAGKGGGVGPASGLGEEAWREGCLPWFWGGKGGREGGRADQRGEGKP